MHRFRFFIDDAAGDGDIVTLSAADAEHVRVLRLAAGDAVEIVDADGRVWSAQIVDGASARVTSVLAQAEHEPVIELIAGALVGGRFDELVDAAVQAGATTITPLAMTPRDAQRLASRRDRLQRIARSAAKQSKRRAIPVVGDPIDAAALAQLDAGIVLDAHAPALLDEAVRAAGTATRHVRLLVGPAAGLASSLIQSLEQAGWTRARLGPSILRAELAAPVAVAIAAMHAPDYVQGRSA